MSITVTEHLLISKILTIDDFVESDVILKLYHEMNEHAKFGISKVADQKGGLEAKEDVSYKEIQHYGRISETAFYSTFSESAKKHLGNISKEIADILGVSTQQMEPWQCTRYFTGGKFDYHDDCGNWGSNERLYSVMLTLRSADFGGATHFKRLNKTVESKAGRLLIWRNLDEDNLCNGQMQHAGMPVGQLGQEDEKMILVTWIRIKDYVS